MEEPELKVTCFWPRFSGDTNSFSATRSLTVSEPVIAMSAVRVKLAAVPSVTEALAAAIVIVGTSATLNTGDIP